MNQTIDEQLAAAQGRLTELQQRFVECAHDADERSRIYNEIRATRREIDRLSRLQPAA